jgi:hypothetical protein
LTILPRGMQLSSDGQPAIDVANNTATNLPTAYAYSYSGDFPTNDSASSYAAPLRSAHSGGIYGERQPIQRSEGAANAGTRSSAMRATNACSSLCAAASSATRSPGEAFTPHLSSYAPMAVLCAVSASLESSVIAQRQEGPPPPSRRQQEPYGATTSIPDSASRSITSSAPPEAAF